MKKVLMLLSAASLAIVMVGCQPQPEGDLKPENQVDKVAPETKTGQTPTAAPMAGGDTSATPGSSTKPADDSKPTVPGTPTEKPADDGTKVEPGAKVPETKSDPNSKPTGT
ncbi:MAG: hypothetical protein ABL962_06465 [Fimbriimonadaceae bacterium]